MNLLLNCIKIIGGIKMKKKLVTTLAISSLLLVACGGEEASSNEESTEQTSSSTEQIEQTSESTEQTSTEQTSSSEETQSSEGTPKQQVGDVIEGDELSRTVTGTAYNIDETQSSGDFDVTLNNMQTSNVQVDDEATAELLGGTELGLIAAEIEVTNNSDATNTIHPNQANFVTDTGDQVSTNLWISDDVGGDFLGQVTKEGSVYATYEGNTEDVNEVRYIIDSGHNEDFENFGEDIEFTVEF